MNLFVHVCLWPHAQRGEVPRVHMVSLHREGSLINHTPPCKSMVKVLRAESFRRAVLSVFALGDTGAGRGPRGRGGVGAGGQSVAVLTLQSGWGQGDLQDSVWQVEAAC